MIYDGSCPICRMEMTEFMRRNTQGLLKFADLSAPDFDLAAYTWRQHATWDEMNALLHAQRPDGSFIIGVEAVRLAYEAVGWGRVWQPTRWRLLNPLAELAYALWARNRHTLSRWLGPLIVRMEAGRSLARMQACKAAACDVQGGAS